MSKSCDLNPPVTTGRRRFLAYFGLTAGALAISSLLPHQLAVAASLTPPKPQNMLSPDAALKRLMGGQRSLYSWRR